jgi:hypothetical protein
MDDREAFARIIADALRAHPQVSEAVATEEQVYGRLRAGPRFSLTVGKCEFDPADYDDCD